MGWTWEQSQATPLLIRRRWAGFLFTKRRAQAARTPASPAQTEKDRSEAQRNIAAAAAEVQALEEVRGDT